MADPPAAPRPDRTPPPGEAEAHGSARPAGSSGQAAPMAHVVPATPAGEEQRCPGCGALNRPGIAFCATCGRRLPSAGAPAERPSAAGEAAGCPRCDTPNPAGAAFCQRCGANLRAAEAVTAAAVEPAPDLPLAPPRPWLGPAVLVIGAAGMILAWALPFDYGSGSLLDRTLGPGGWGLAFWSGYPSAVDGLAAQIYFGFAAPVPLLILGLLVLAGWGLRSAAPQGAQRIGLLVAGAWALALSVGFVGVELLAGPGGGVIAVLRALSPAGVIFLLAGLVSAIGVATRLARG